MWVAMSSSPPTATLRWFQLDILLPPSLGLLIAVAAVARRRIAEYLPKY
jgi:hypothetical protein